MSKQGGEFAFGLSDYYRESALRWNPGKEFLLYDVLNSWLARRYGHAVKNGGRTTEIRPRGPCLRSAELGEHFPRPRLEEGRRYVIRFLISLAIHNFYLKEFIVMNNARILAVSNCIYKVSNSHLRSPYI